MRRVLVHFLDGLEPPVDIMMTRAREVARIAQPGDLHYAVRYFYAFILGQPDNGAPGGNGRAHTGRRVFENEALGWIKLKAPGRFHVHVWGGLASGNFIAANSIYEILAAYDCDGGVRDVAVRICRDHHRHAVLVQRG